ncbi:histone-lysine N-methyltransferase SUV39H1-like isoform 3-T5 [Salvelinus alpinus]|uniref:histone-lysine N-methyltransferase SUV39H1-like isoform X3 n=1 Tax=Salvelinus alpinus TaxID=8036 RepID=UPI0039FD6B19
MVATIAGCSVSCKLSLDDLQAVCRRERLHCKQLRVNKHNIDDYEVEYLCDYKKSKEQEFYLVKWKGYPESSNTWEPRKNLKCRKLMTQFHEDMEHELRRQKRRTTCPKRLDKDVAWTLVQKAKLRKRLQCWEADLNKTRNHPGRIFVLNEVDLDGPPRDFTYITNYKVGEGIVLNEMAVGCECKDCFSDPIGGCCPGASLHRLAYTDKGQVRVRAGEPIYECNARCSCGPDCSNRLVQKGIQFDLCIFKTGNGRGWGVRALQHIKKNTFVMEYVGEIITSDEAEKRGHLYDRQGATYLFDLDYVEDVYTVDAANHGNISHFVNHSCNPNLQVYNVFIDNLDERLPRIALFSTRSIRAGEELTFDYKMQIDHHVGVSSEQQAHSVIVDPVDAESTRMDSNFSLAGLPSSPKKRIRVECRCGSDTCRKYLF